MYYCLELVVQYIGICSWYKCLNKSCICRELLKQSVRHLSCCLMMRDSVINVRPLASFLLSPAQTVPSVWCVSITLRICAAAPLISSTSGIYPWCSCGYVNGFKSAIVYNNVIFIQYFSSYSLILQVQIYPGWVVRHVTSIKGSVRVFWSLGQPSKRSAWTRRRP